MKVQDSHCRDSNENVLICCMTLNVYRSSGYHVTHSDAQARHGVYNQPAVQSRCRDKRSAGNAYARKAREVGHMREMSEAG